MSKVYWSEEERMKKKASNKRLESPDPGKDGIYIKNDLWRVCNVNFKLTKILTKIVNCFRCLNIPIRSSSPMIFLPTLPVRVPDPEPLPSMPKV